MNFSEPLINLRNVSSSGFLVRLRGLFIYLIFVQ